MKNQFAKNLQEELVIKRISQKTIAEQLGVTPSTVNQWIKGKREPHYDMLLQLCSILNSTPTLMLGFSQTRNETK